MPGKIEDRRSSGQQKMKWLDGIINSINVSLSKLREIVKDREAWPTASMRSERVSQDLATELEHSLFP